MEATMPEEVMGLHRVSDPLKLWLRGMRVIARGALQRVPKSAKALAIVAFYSWPLVAAEWAGAHGYVPRAGAPALGLLGCMVWGVITFVPYAIGGDVTDD